MLAANSSCCLLRFDVIDTSRVISSALKGDHALLFNLSDQRLGEWHDAATVIGQTPIGTSRRPGAIEGAKRITLPFKTAQNARSSTLIR